MEPTKHRSPHPYIFIPNATMRNAKRYSYAWYRKVKNSIKTHANRSGIERTIFTPEVEQIFKKDYFRCHYCRMSENDSEKFFGGRLTLDRLDSTKGYTPDNTVVACDFCNQVHTYSDGIDIPEEVVKRAGKLMKHYLLKGRSVSFVQK